MRRLRRICGVAIVVATLGGLFTSGASALDGSELQGVSAGQPASEPQYSLYVDFLRLGKLSINASTHECKLEGLVVLTGECSAESTFSASLFVSPGTIEVGVEVEGIPQHTGRVAYAGRGRISLEFAGQLPVWVEVRKSL